MRLCHTEASTGWGGQEIRTFNEACALREKGHDIYFIIQKKAQLARRLKEKGFRVLEINFFKKAWFFSLPLILIFLLKNKIDLVVTHSSLDSWLASIAAKTLKISVVRIRHVSTATKKGLNAKLLFRKLADFIITTSTEIIHPLAEASGQPLSNICCIPTGVNPENLSISQEKVEEFRKRFNLHENDIILGSVCVVRSWKGIENLISAANLLRDEPNLKWLIVGGGYLEHHIKRVQELKLDEKVIFTGHLEDPKIAIAALDVFLLLSTANEGISQASLQAAFLEKPLITTPTGGLKEVCIHEKTGLIVPIKDPEAVAKAVLRLKDPNLRKNFGVKAKYLVEQRFLFKKTLQQVEDVYMRFSCLKS
jgi:glycosyltransferase involved in cell wall biosynthesis